MASISVALDRGLDLLTKNDRDAPDRQRTMEDALAWSYQLLDDPSSVLLRRLGVWVGGVGVDAVGALADDLCLDRASLFDILDDLVAHSLVARSVDGRFTLLEVVREFAVAQLAYTGELDTAVRRHCAYFVAFAEEASVHLSGPDQLRWLDQLHRDAANLSAAVRRAIERSDADSAIRLCLALRFLWYVRGPLIEGQAFFAAALALPGVPQRLRMQALVEAAALARHGGELDTAAGLAADALELARNIGEPDLLAAALLQHGFVLHLREHYNEARTALHECLAIRDAAGDRLGAARALHHLGLVIYYGDADVASAWDVQVRCLTVFRELSNQRHIATVLIAMTELARAGGEPATARELMSEGFDLVGRLQDQPLLNYALYGAAALAADEGHPSRAVRLIGAAESVQRSCGAQPWPAVAANSQRWLSHVIARLGQPRVTSLRAAGARLTAAQAVALALAPDDADRSDPLTARERQIADLVRAGLTNRAIATRLVISERTVDGHVAHILSKLGVTSRAQIAAWSATQPTSTAP